MVRALCALAALLAASLAWGQGKVVRLVFESAGPRAVWIAQAPPEAEPAAAIEIEGGTYELKSTNPGKLDSIFVWDKTTGNLASKPLVHAGSDWKVVPSDFRFAMKVRIKVEHEGKPIEAASVSLRDGRQDVSKIIDPSSGGGATFWAVRFGVVKVGATYNSGGKTKGPLVQQFQLVADRTNPEETFVVGLADPVRTLDGRENGSPAAQSTAGEPGKDVAKPGAEDRPTGNDTTNPLGGLISFLIALAIGAAAIWFGMKWMKQNESVVQEKLEAMGVQIPDKPDDAGDATTVLSTAPPPPPEKIILDDAPLIPNPVAGTSGAPRLVGEMGTFELAEGDSTVSREHGSIVIPNESTVSRRHATVSRKSGQVAVRDDGSTNGTYVNGVRIDSETILKPGDTVQFGGVAFRYEA